MSLRISAVQSGRTGAGEALEAGREYIKSCGYFIEADGLCAKDVDEGHADESERMKAFRAGWLAALSQSTAGEDGA